MVNLHSLIILILINMAPICATTPEPPDSCKRRLFVCIDPKFLLSDPNLVANLTRSILDYGQIWTKIVFFHNHPKFTVTMPQENEHFVSKIVNQTKDSAEHFNFIECTLSLRKMHDATLETRSTMFYVAEMKLSTLVELSEEYIVAVDVKNHLIQSNNASLTDNTRKMICHPDLKCNSEVVVVNGTTDSDVQCAGSLVGITCNIFCDEQFAENGDFPVCLYGGWANDKYVCKKVFCETSKLTTENGSHNCGAYVSVNQTCDVTCDAQYTKYRPALSLCVSDGAEAKWDHIPICKNVCPEPPKIENGEVGDCDGDRCARVVCNDGYRQEQGDAVLRCDKEGETPRGWVNKPKCVQIVCASALEIENADAESLDKCVGTRYNHQCKIQCQETFKLIERTSGTLTCLKDRLDQGRWYNLPNCVKLKCKNLYIQGSKEDFACSQSIVGTLCEVICSIGFTLKDPLKNTTLCVVESNENANWDTPPECTKRICPLFSSLAPQIITTDCQQERRFRYVCQNLSCAENHVLVLDSGSNPACTVDVETDTMYWNHLPTCLKIRCGMSPSVRDRDKAVFCESGEINQTCLTACREGYKLHPAPGGDMTCALSLSLNSAHWANVPLCLKENCDAMAPVENAVAASLCTSSPPGTRCVVLCENGFRKDPGADVPAVCETAGPDQKPDWADAPKCVEIRCAEPPSALNMIANVSCADKPLGFVCSWHCEESTMTNYGRKGDSECALAADGASGEWSNAEDCVPFTNFVNSLQPDFRAEEYCFPRMCSYSPKVNNSEAVSVNTCGYKEVGAECDVVCENGFVEVGEKYVCNEKGVWEGDLRCVAVENGGWWVQVVLFALSNVLVFASGIFLTFLTVKISYQERDSVARDVNEIIFVA